MEQHFLTEASKVISAKHSELTTELQSAETRAAELQAATLASKERVGTLCGELSALQAAEEQAHLAESAAVSAMEEEKTKQTAFADIMSLAENDAAAAADA